VNYRLAPIASVKVLPQAGRSPGRWLVTSTFGPFPMMS
jgi:hypothetical protein